MLTRWRKHWTFDATLVLLGVLAARLASAQSVELPKEKTAAVGGIVVIIPKVDGGPAKWRVSPPGLEEIDLAALYPTGGKPAGKLFIGAKAGTYSIECWNAKGDVASDIAVCLVVIGTPPAPTPDPGPNPNPNPDPTPTPTPTVQPIFVSFWSETSTRKPEDKTVLSSKAVRTACGEWVRVYDPDVEMAKYVKFKPFLDKVGMPAMVIQNRDTGKVLEVVKLPANETDALTIIHKWGGTK